MQNIIINLHEGFQLNIEAETILESYNQVNRNGRHEKTYTFFIISKKITDEAFNSHLQGDVKHKDMYVDTDEGTLLIHRFTSLDINDLQQFVTHELETWFFNHQHKIIRITRDQVNVNVTKLYGERDFKDVIFLFSNE